MRRASQLRFRLLSAAIAAASFGSVVANSAQAATYYFDVNGSTSGFGSASGNYDWDATTNGGLWTTDSTGVAATSGWSQANFPQFQITPAATYTVTVSNEEQVAGMYNATANTNLTINASGAGALKFVGGGTQGIINTSGSTLTINAPITGTGTIVNPNSGGTVALYGTNTYAGGTSLTSSATLINFNNNASFGTGTITNNLSSTTGFVPLLGKGGTTITLPNNWVNAVDNSGLNFGADANTPVVTTGTWSLGTKSLRLRNNGDSTSPLTLSGAISGSVGLILSGNNNGSIVLKGTNTSFTGPVTITGPGAAGSPGTNPIRLVLGVSNTIAHSSQLILAGGILDPDGLNQTMNSTTLALLTSTNPSVIDFGVGGTELDFANSSAVSWTGAKLNLVNWNPAVDKIRFDSSSAGLTAAQLAKIEFNGAGLGTGHLDANGYLVVPEPASLSLVGLGAAAVLARRRRA